MFERKRVLVVIKPSVLGTYLDGKESAELDLEQLVEHVEEVLGEEEQEEGVEVEETHIDPEDVVVPLIQANRLASSRRMAVLRIATDWARDRKREILVAQGVPKNEIIPNDMTAVALSREDMDYYMAMTQVSVVVGSLDWDADDMQNFEPPPYSDVHAWVNDLPDRLFDPIFDASLIVNGHWSIGDSEKNLIMPG